MKRTTTRVRPAPDGFRRIVRTDRNGVGVRRLECLACGREIVPSGLGVGSHRSGCPGHPPTKEEA